MFFYVFYKLLLNFWRSVYRVIFSQFYQKMGFLCFISFLQKLFYQLLFGQLFLIFFYFIEFSLSLYFDKSSYSFDKRSVSSLSSVLSSNSPFTFGKNYFSSYFYSTGESSLSTGFLESMPYVVKFYLDVVIFLEVFLNSFASFYYLRFSLASSIFS